MGVVSHMSALVTIRVQICMDIKCVCVIMFVCWLHSLLSNYLHFACRRLSYILTLIGYKAASV